MATLLWSRTCFGTPIRPGYTYYNPLSTHRCDGPPTIPWTRTCDGNSILLDTYMWSEYNNEIVYHTLKTLIYTWRSYENLWFCFKCVPVMYWLTLLANSSHKLQLTLLVIFAVATWFRGRYTVTQPETTITLHNTIKLKIEPYHITFSLFQVF